MVRLKDLYAQKDFQCLYTFNSYMVRLKERRWLGLDFGFTNFQFLYGTIKRAKLFKLPLRAVIFQFLYGTIKSVSL